MSTAETFARQLAAKHNIIVRTTEQYMTGFFVHGTYASRQFSVPVEFRVKPHGEAWRGLRTIVVPPFGAVMSDGVVLAVWLHEMGHICGWSQSMLQWLQSQFRPHSRAFCFFRLLHERGAWAWARRQTKFTDEMSLNAAESLMTYEVYVYRHAHLVEYV